MILFLKFDSKAFLIFLLKESLDCIPTKRTVVPSSRDPFLKTHWMKSIPTINVNSHFFT